MAEYTSEQQDEFDTLKERAKQLNIPVGNRGLDALRKAVNDKINGTESDTGTKVTFTKKQLKMRKERMHRDRASSLVRIQLTNMNPNTREHTNVLIQAGNARIGRFKEVVPFDVEWHVPRIIVNALKECKVQLFTTRNVRGVPVPKSRLINEFNVVELDQISKKELDDLAKIQAASGSLED